MEVKVVYAGTHNTGWAITDYKSYPDCLSSVGSSVWMEEAVLLIVIAAIQVYACIILWSHYKNATLKKSKGGCVEDSGLESPVARVAHSVSDSDNSDEGSSYDETEKEEGKAGDDIELKLNTHE